MPHDAGSCPFLEQNAASRPPRAPLSLRPAPRRALTRGMLDATPLPRLQRARGRADVAVSVRGGRVRLDRLVQEGCGKALMPRTHGPVPEVVLVNTSGGVTGGGSAGQGAPGKQQGVAR